MTPVEERIDREAARRRLSAWRYGEPGVYHTDAELKADITALLTEHSAREEVIEAAQGVIDALPDMDVTWHPGTDDLAFARLRAKLAALPATEPAQPEDDGDDEPNESHISGALY